MPYRFDSSHAKVREDGHASFLQDPAPMGEHFRALVDGAQLTPEFRANLPKAIEITFDRPEAKLTHMMPDGTQPIWTFHRKLTDELERLEPGVHEFVPISVRNEDGSLIDGENYRLSIITQKIECFDLDRTFWRTALEEKFGEAAAQDANFRPFDLEVPVHLKGAEIEGKHLWRGAPGHGARTLYCSDAVADFVKRKELRGWELIPVEVV